MGANFGLWTWALIGLAPAAFVLFREGRIIWPWLLHAGVISLVAGAAFGFMMFDRLGRRPDDQA